jgi:cytochrome c-type biogenesis protein CcmH/NrfG
LIWLILVGVVFVAAGTWFVAKSMQTRLIVLVAGLAAVGSYWVIGKPGMADDPLGARVEQLEAREKSTPGQLTPDERLAVLQERSLKSPGDPRPLKEIGDLYAAAGRMEDAQYSYRAALQRSPTDEPTLDALSELAFLASGTVDQATLDKLPRIRDRARTNPESLTTVQLVALLEERTKAAPEDPMPYRILGDVMQRIGHADKAEAAYRAAIERDPKNLEAITSLADLRFKSTGQVDVFTTQLYQTAFEAQPDHFRLGYLAGIGLWLQGKKDEAEKLWADINARAPQEGPERQMFAALRQMFKIDPVPGAPAAPAGPSPKPPG